MCILNVIVSPNCLPPKEGQIYIPINCVWKYLSSSLSSIIGVINLSHFGYSDGQKMDISLQFVFLKVDPIYGQKFLIWICISLIHMLISNLDFFSGNCLFISFIHFLSYFSFFLFVIPTLSHYIHYILQRFPPSLSHLYVCVCELTSQACAEHPLQLSWGDSHSHGLGWAEAESRAVRPKPHHPHPPPRPLWRGWGRRASVEVGKD